MSSIFNNSTSNSLFSSNNYNTNNLFRVSNLNNNFEENFAPKRRNNKKRINLKFIKCEHNDKFCAFNPDKEIGLICYDCIYKYNLDKDECISMTEDFNYYKNIYQVHLNKVKEKIKFLINSILIEIEKLEKNTFNNFTELVENIDLNFKLPIEVPLDERLKIGINKKFSKMINNLINNDYLDNYLNLYETKLKNLKQKFEYSYDDENITLKSEIPFTLKAMAFPKLSKELQDNIKIKFKDNITSEYQYQTQKEISINFEENEENNLTIGRFNSPLKIEKNNNYIINISGIRSCNYIDDEEEFNIHNKILIESDKGYNILACLIID